MRFKQFIAEYKRFHGKLYRHGLVHPKKLETDEIDNDLNPDEIAKMELLHLAAGDTEKDDEYGEEG